MPDATKDLIVELPAADGRPDQDREFCDVTYDGRTRRIRFHDYAEIYAIPGLYEELFHEHLECCSPEAVAGLLGDLLKAEGVDPATLSGLDVGAGNGLVGAELRDLGIPTLVGVDIIQAAADAAERDRPGLYADYAVCDLTEMDATLSERLCAHEPSVMTCVAALGFDDIPPRAFAEGFNLLAPGGWVAFNIKADFLDGADTTGFRSLIVRMLGEGILTEHGRRTYVHRRSMTGEELLYTAIAGTKAGDVPRDWT